MNWQSSCLSFLSIKITGRHDHTCQRDNTLGKVILCKTNKSVSLKMCEDQREDICESVSAHFWPQPAAVTHNYLVGPKCVCVCQCILHTCSHICAHIYTLERRLILNVFSELRQLTTLAYFSSPSLCNFRLLQLDQLHSSVALARWGPAVQLHREKFLL